MYQPSYTDLFFSPPQNDSDHLRPFEERLKFEDFQDLISPNPSYPFQLQRSISSSSFHQHNRIGVGSMRRVFSTGDIHDFSCDNMSIPLPPPESVQLDDHRQQFTDHCGGSVSYSAGRVGRYNAEERRGRIERYRNKRNQRNFQKKITHTGQYACRKTLADRRPRVHGRFTRSDESTETENINHEEQRLRPPQEEEGLRSSILMATEGEDYYGCDELIWANFVDAFNMNNLISWS